MPGIINRLRQNRRGVSNVIVVMLSLILIVIIVSNVVLWSYQMNQLDWERMQENIQIPDVGRITNSAWFGAQSEYTVTVGSRMSGTYTDTQTADDQYERFMEASTTLPLSYNPSGFTVGGSTSWISGSVSELTSDNGVYMFLRSYASATAGQTLLAHQETTTIGGSTYFLLKLGSADAAGATLSASAGTLGRKLMGKFVYPLTGVSSIPASNWTIYYRASQGHVNVESHCDVDISVRMSNGAIRATIAIDVANSGTLTATTSWVTLSGTYSWAPYTVIDQTDYLEIDYYREVTMVKATYLVNLRIDDNTLTVADQTRVTNTYLPSEYTSEVEFIGSSNTETWTLLVWDVDLAWTTGSVAVTIQVYDFTLGAYPAAGNGYDSYVSSSTANTDQMRNQTIPTNSDHFRDGSGNWKIKVKGVKMTTSLFDFKADWIEFKTYTAGYYSLDMAGTFIVDISTYLLAHIQTVEIQLRYRADDVGEKWYLKAYNWSSSTYSDSGFNSSEGSTPMTGWSYYTVNLTDQWSSYVHTNGTLFVKAADEGADITQTTLDIDFLAVRVAINGTKIVFQNKGPLTSHLVSLWVNNSTHHLRYDVNIFIKSGDTLTHILGDMRLPNEPYLIKIVTDRGNFAVYSAP